MLSGAVAPPVEQPRPSGHHDPPRPRRGRSARDAFKGNRPLTGPRSGQAGGWRRLPKAKRRLRVSASVLEDPYCHQMTTQTPPRGDRRVSENVDFSKIFRCHSIGETIAILGLSGGGGGGCCRLQMPVKLAPAVRETPAGPEAGTAGEGGGYPPPLFQCIAGSVRARRCCKWTNAEPNWACGVRSTLRGVWWVRFRGPY